MSTPQLSHVSSNKQGPRKIYDLIFDLLTNHPDLRDSDKKLIWKIWDELQLIDTTHRCIIQEAFMLAPSTETIRRCRQKIQELHPELQGTPKVKKLRQSIAEQRGTHIFREKLSFSESVKEQMKLI